MPLFSDDDERKMHEAIVAGLEAGQGEYDDLDFAAARADVIQSIVHANTTEMLFEGLLGICVDHGTVKYKAVGERPS